MNMSEDGLQPRPILFQSKILPGTICNKLHMFNIIWNMQEASFCKTLVDLQKRIKFKCWIFFLIFSKTRNIYTHRIRQPIQIILIYINLCESRYFQTRVYLEIVIKQFQQ